MLCQVRLWGFKNCPVDRNAHNYFKEQRRRGHIILNSLGRFFMSIRLSRKLMDIILPAANYQQERSILDCLQNLGEFCTAVDIAILPRL
jgi:hypothetical protein